MFPEGYIGLMSNTLPGKRPFFIVHQHTFSRSKVIHDYEGPITLWVNIVKCGSKYLRHLLYCVALNENCQSLNQVWLYVWWFQVCEEWSWDFKMSIFRFGHLLLSLSTLGSMYNYNWNSFGSKMVLQLYDPLEMLSLPNSRSVSSCNYVTKLCSATKALGETQGVHAGKAVTHQREP